MSDQIQEHSEPSGAVPSSRAELNWTRSDRLALGAMMAFTALMGCVGLDSKELWLDEVDSWYVVSGSFSDMLSVIATWDLNSSPYFVGLWIWTRFGDSPTWMRLPSVIGAVVAIPLIAHLGRQLFDRQVGLVAALLVSTSGAMLFHVQEVRTYAILTAWATGTSILFLRAERERSTRPWLLYAAVSIGLVAMHLFGVLVIAAHAIWLILTQPERIRHPERGLVAAIIAIAVVCLPLAMAILSQSSHYVDDFAGEPWDVGTYLQVADFWSGGSRVGTVLALVAILAVAAALGRSMLDRTAGRVSSEWFVMLGVVVPTALLAIASLGPNVVVSRYLILSVPCFAILVAHGAQLLPRAIGSAMIVAIVVSSLFAVRSWHEADSHDPFEELTAHLVSELQPGDQVAFLESYDRLGVLYNARDVPPDLIPTLVADETMDPPAWRGDLKVADPALATSNGRLWVIVRTEEGETIADHAAVLESWAADGLEPTTIIEFPQRTLLRFDVAAG